MIAPNTGPLPASSIPMIISTPFKGDDGDDDNNDDDDNDDDYYIFS